MSDFEAAVAGLNDVILNTFASTVEVALSDAATLMLSGAFEARRDSIEKNVANSYRYTLTVKTTDVYGFAIERGMTVTVNSVVYTIIDIIPDDGGMTVWILRRYG
jgi:hypothetical protein